MAKKKLHDHNLILDMGINNIVGDRNLLSDYIAKHELWDKLTKPEQDFLNEVSMACQTLADTNVKREKL